MIKFLVYFLYLSFQTLFGYSLASFLRASRCGFAYLGRFASSGFVVCTRSNFLGLNPKFDE